VTKWRFFGGHSVLKLQTEKVYDLLETCFSLLGSWSTTIF